MDYRILIALLVTFLCMSIGTNAREIDGFTEQQNQSENWLLGTTKRFDTFQAFFLERGGEAVFQSGYLYDLEKENWLSFAEAKEVAAELTPILNQEDILVDISKAALVDFVNIDLSNSKRYALLFFDTPIEADGTYMFVGADKMRFKRPVVPGDQLTLKATILAEKRGIWKFGCESEVEGKMVATGEILCADRNI